MTLSGGMGRGDGRWDSVDETRLSRRESGGGGGGDDDDIEGEKRVLWFFLDLKNKTKKKKVSRFNYA